VPINIMKERGVGGGKVSQNRNFARWTLERGAKGKRRGRHLINLLKSGAGGGPWKNNRRYWLQYRGPGVPRESSEIEGKGGYSIYGTQIYVREWAIFLAPTVLPDKGAKISMESWAAGSK